MIGYILLWIAIVLAIIIIAKYNQIITLKNNRENAFADIDVQLKQRADMIPNLVEIVKWYAKHEKETFENVTKARTAYMNATWVEWKMEANNMITSALKSLFAVSENYPELKANQNFMHVQTELSDVENKLAATRRFFNSATKEFNTFVEMFPTNIIARLFGFKELPSFTLWDDRAEVEKAPKIEF